MFVKDPPKNTSVVKDFVLEFKTKEKKEPTEEEEETLTGDDVEVCETPILPEIQRVTLPNLETQEMQVRLAMSKAFWIMGAGGIDDDTGKLLTKMPPKPEDIPPPPEVDPPKE